MVYDTDKIYRKLGVTLMKTCYEQNMNQKMLADKTGIQAPDICYWFSGKRHPTILSFVKLCNGLGVTADEIFKRCEKE